MTAGLVSRVLGLGFLTVMGAMLFLTTLPDRIEAMRAIAMTGPDITHPREDVVFAIQVELALRGFDP